MRLIQIPFFLLLAACSTAGPASMGGGPDVPVSHNPTGTGGEFHIQPDLVVASLEVPAGADKAWPALLTVFDELEIPAREVDLATYTIRNRRWVVSRRVGGQRLSEFLDCGRSASGFNADTHRLQLEIASRIVAQGADRSRVETQIQGIGMNMEGTSNSRVACTSNHQLEFAIAQRVRDLVRGDGSN